jgi:hypothetical protein
MASPPDSRKTSISFNIEGQIADLFDKVREAAKSHPDFWGYGNLTRTDLARHLLTKELVDLAKQLGVLDDD